MNDFLIYDPDTGLPIQATAYVQQASNAGNDAGTIANYLVQAGLALGDISQVINAVQHGGMVPSQQVQALQVQQQYLAQQAAQKQGQTTMLLIAALIGVAYFASR